MNDLWCCLVGLIVGTAVCLAGASASAEPGVGGKTTLFVEAEGNAAPVANARAAAGWVVTELEGASGGKVLFASGRARAESDAIPVTIQHPGVYRIWVRYFKKAPTGSNMYGLVRDEAGAALALKLLDWQPTPAVPGQRPYEKPAPPSGDKTGFVWESFDARFDRPIVANLSVGGGVGERAVDCFIVTNDTVLAPQKVDAAQLSALATTPAGESLVLPPPPAGFTLSPGLPTMVDFYAGIDNPDQRFYAGLLGVGSMFQNYTSMVRMGFNRDHTGLGIIGKWEIRAMQPVEFIFFLGSVPQDFLKAHPSPEGRFVNAKGEVARAFSLHYQPWADLSIEHLKDRVRGALNSPDADNIGWWRITAEEGGWLDYSTYAVDAFRKWLKEKHGTVGVLNQRWGTRYAGFDEITPAKTYDEGHASYLEFRDFSGRAYAGAVGRQLPIIQAMDPKHRPCMGASSSLDIAAPFFMAFRPNDFEELVRVGLKDSKFFAFDDYCADDDMGDSIDFFNSIAQGRKLINQEFGVHAVDPRIAARTCWTQIGKGVHGLNLFTFQGEPNGDSYPKWGLLSADLSPKQKLAAFSDAVQEVHRIEPLLMAATYTHAVKPVAMYWSRMDLGLDQPHDSWYGHGLNSPIHVYETLRSIGYPVRWITPRQITEGELDGVGALVMAGCNHVPQAAAAKIEGWVKGGGTIIADSWPGAFDEYGQPQAALSPIFGVRPAPKKIGKKGSQLALEQSAEGYGEVTDAAVVRENYFQKIDELAQQPGATNPVALALGDFMLTGYNLDPVECTAGQLIGMTHGGRPALIVNDYGKGKSLYSAFLLGTIYECAPVRYEWDTTHSGLSYGRLLDAFLKYAGVAPGSKVIGPTPRIVAKLRVESPLVTPEGNVLVSLTSFNDDVVQPFELEVQLPPDVVGPFTNVLVATGGSRRLEKVDFHLNGSTLKLRMPSFDTHAMILALKNAGPLVSLELRGVQRGPVGLAVIQPGQSFEIEAVVHNPSPRELAPGRVALAIPAGWLQSGKETSVTAIPAGGEAHGSFRVRAPEIAGPCRIEPFVAHYQSESIKASPAAEMFWWGLKAQ